MVKKILRYLENNRIIAADISVLFALIIFYFSSIPGDGNISKISISIIPIIYHFVIFFLFTFFLFIALKGNRNTNKKFIAIALMLSLIYAVLDEVHQIFILFRNPSVKDVLIDFLGSFCSVITYSYLNNIKK